jgi:hypothetical protein
MSDNFDTVLVEFRCPLEKSSESNNPVEELESFFKKQKRGFAIEERSFKKEEVADDPEWTEWLSANSSGYENGIFLAVFMVSKKDRPYFADLFQEYLRAKRASQ